MTDPAPPATLVQQDLENLEEGEKVHEHDPPDSPQRTPLFSRAYLLGPVKRGHADLALLACCFVTGLVDAGSYANWSVYVGMQTGNTVILALSTGGLLPERYAWLTTLVSISSFLVGCFCTFRVCKIFAPQDAYSNRLVITSLFLIQSLLLVLAAALATPPGLIPQNPTSLSNSNPPRTNLVGNIRIVSLLPPLAFQSGIQISCSRLLGIGEIPVNVLTSTYCDIMGDFKLLALNNVKRNRRVSAVVLVLGGAISSTWLMKSSGGLKSVLWLAAGIKLITAAALFCFMPTAELIRSISK